ncbi:MAG: transposase [Candidatus Binataceae bacterium]
MLSIELATGERRIAAGASRDQNRGALDDQNNQSRFDLRTSSRAVRFYNKRGTAEQWIKEGKQAVAMTRLSCHRVRIQANQVRPWLSVIAYKSRQPMAAAGVAGRHRQVVADQLAAAAGENRRPSY